MDILVVIGVIQLIAVLLSLLAVRIRDGAIDLFNPLVVVLVSCPFIYTLSMYQLAFGENRLFSAVVPWLATERGAQISAGLLAVLGIALMAAGYCIGTRLIHQKRTPGRLHSTSGMSSSCRRRCTLVTIIGIGLFGALVIISGGVGGLLDNLANRTVFFAGKNYLAFGPYIVAGAVGARLIAEDRWPASATTWCLVAVSLVLATLSGTRTAIGTMALFYVAIVHFRYRPMRFRVILPAMILGPLVLSGYELYFRDAVPRNVPFAQVLEERGGVMGALGQLSDGGLFGEQALTLALVEYPNPHPFVHLDSALAFLMAPIPRGLVPSKPDAPSGAFTDTFAPVLHDQGSTIPPTALGEMYMSFGWLGVAAGCTTFGLMLSAIYRRRLLGDRELLLAALSAASVVYYVRGETYGVLVGVLMAWLPGWWVLGKSREDETTH